MTSIPSRPDFQKDKMPSKVIALISDLFFIAKVEAAARQAGVPILIVASPEQLPRQANVDPP
jgi:ribosomal protein L7Ae-like RNA K-turn-binding protein